jgi:hypothetical protein
MLHLFKKYPQNIWANEITLLIKQKKIEYFKDSIFVDSPCGNGIIGNLVFHDCEKLKIQMRISDINPEIMDSPYSKVNNSNFTVLVEDIFNQKLEGKNNVWLFINSLYCLPNADSLIAHQRENFKTIIAVFPNINSFNYQYFMSQNKHFNNPTEMSLNETIEFFEKHGYGKIIFKKNTRIPFHFWNNIFNKIRLNLVLRNVLFTIFDKLLFFLPGQYAIIVFSKNE